MSPRDAENQLFRIVHILWTILRLAGIVHSLWMIFSIWIVISTPSMICLLTFAIECKRRSRPLTERKDGSQGIMTESAATRALMVIIPSDGIQSIRL
jgi:hypothetical protein